MRAGRGGGRLRRLPSGGERPPSCSIRRTSRGKNRLRIRGSAPDRRKICRWRRKGPREHEHIHPIQWILLIGMVAAFIYYKKKMAPPKDPPTLGVGGAPRPSISQKAKPEKPEESAETVYKELRKKALETTRSRLALPEGFPEDAPHGLLMEMAMPGSSVVTLACFATGDASVYYRTGGGMVGGIGHENVRNIAKEFVDQARTVLPRISSQRLPAAGERPDPLLRADREGALHGRGGPRDPGGPRVRPRAPVLHRPGSGLPDAAGPGAEVEGGGRTGDPGRRLSRRPRLGSHGRGSLTRAHEASRRNPRRGRARPGPHRPGDRAPGARGEAAGLSRRSRGNGRAYAGTERLTSRFSPQPDRSRQTPLPPWGRIQLSKISKPPHP